MKLGQITLALLALTSLASEAAIEDRQVASCAAMKNPIERLACYDKLADTHDLAPKTVATPAHGKGKWHTSTSTDPLTDKAIYVATLDADSGRGRFGEGIDMVVRCAKGETDLYINWESFLGTDGISLTYRVGKAKAVKSTWLVSTDNKSSFYPGSPVSTLKAMIDTDSFVANVTPYSESPVTATFDTSGAKEALSDIRTACKW